MHRRLRLALFAALLAGCASGLGGCVNGLAEREAFLRTLVGMNEADLVRTLGVPSRTVEAEGRRFLAYRESRLDIIPAAPMGFWGWHGGLAYGGGFPPEVVQRTCETTFELLDGRVAGFTLRGNACD